MPYQVRMSKAAMKTLAKMNEPHYSRIRAAIFKLADNPRPQGCKKLENRPGYRIRIGDYRVIYDIHDNELVVEVLAVGARGGVYG
jgi:mRNA interferase RelE/StbE